MWSLLEAFLKKKHKNSMISSMNLKTFNKISLSIGIITITALLQVNRKNMQSNSLTGSLTKSLQEPKSIVRCRMKIFIKELLIKVFKDKIMVEEEAIMATTINTIKTCTEWWTLWWWCKICITININNKVVAIRNTIIKIRINIIIKIITNTLTIINKHKIISIQIIIKISRIRVNKEIKIIISIKAIINKTIIKSVLLKNMTIMAIIIIRAILIIKAINNIISKRIKISLNITMNKINRTNSTIKVADTKVDTKITEETKARTLIRIEILNKIISTTRTKTATSNSQNKTFLYLTMKIRLNKAKTP